MTSTATVDPIAIPWLRADGQLVRADDGRSGVLRGPDYNYPSTGVGVAHSSVRYVLDDDDFRRIAGWGMNAIRIHLNGERAGFYPHVSPEPGYMGGLDRIIRGANEHGLYVLISVGSNSIVPNDHPEDATFDREKFVAGTAANEYWLAWMLKLFERYRAWPGVVGYDLVNEDYSYPPEVHDRVFMGEGHRMLLERLRSPEYAGDRRHIYFQQPSAWSYWNQNVVGHDLGDDNTFFCPKWTPNEQGTAHMDKMRQWAADADAGLVVCEWVQYDADSNDDSIVATAQAAQRLFDDHLVGNFRNVYQPGAPNSLLNEDGSERTVVPVLARPYPAWVGGDLTSVDYDFASRRLAFRFRGDNASESDVFASAQRTYPDGFVVTVREEDGSPTWRLVHDGAGVVESGGDLAWDAATERITIPPRKGDLVVTIEPESTTATPAGVGEWANPTADAAAPGGDGDGFEQMPSGAYSAGGDVASNVDGVGDRHDFFGFPLPSPAGTRLAGIEVEVDWWADTGSGSPQLAVQLSGDGGASWTAPKQTSAGSGAPLTSSLGGAADRWGRGWNGDAVEASGLMVRVTSVCAIALICPGRDWHVDSVRLRLHFETPAIVRATKNAEGWVSPSQSAETEAGDGNGFEANIEGAYSDGAGHALNADGAGDQHVFAGFRDATGGVAVSGVEVRLDWWVDEPLLAPRFLVEVSTDGGMTWSASRSTAGGTRVEATTILGGAGDTWGVAWPSRPLDQLQVRVTSTCDAEAICPGRDYFLDWVAVRLS